MFGIGEVLHRIGETMQHLTDPENKVYYLGMEGEFFEVDLRTLETTQLFDLMKELNEQKGATFIFSTHDPMVMDRARRIISLRDGQIHSDERK